MVARRHGNEADLERAEKKRQVIELRRQGVTYDVIHKMVGISRATAFKWVSDELRIKAAELSTSVGEHRAESLDRLEALLNACWSRAMTGDTKSIDAARRIISDIGDLTGSKVPVKFELGASDVQAALAEIQRVLDERARVVEGSVVSAPGQEAAGRSVEPDRVQAALPDAGSAG